MLIGFLGDVHGRVFHALAILVTWQMQTGRRFDLVIQVGDMGSFPDPARADAATMLHQSLDPAEADFARLLSPDGRLAARLRRVREHLAGPIHFLRGNHEDFAWLNTLPVDTQTQTAPVDPFDLFRYVPDGTILRAGALRLAFLGGVEEQAGEAAIDAAAYAAVLDLGYGEIDVLVAHEGQYGTSIGFRGDVHGSMLMTRLIERTQPDYFVFGHAHQPIGPGQHGRTTYLGLDGLVASRRWQPEVRGFQPGCLAVLDTQDRSLIPVTDPWLAAFDTRQFGIDAWAEGIFANQPETGQV